MRNDFWLGIFSTDKKISRTNNTSSELIGRSLIPVVAKAFTGSQSRVHGVLLAIVSKLQRDFSGGSFVDNYDESRGGVLSLSGSGELL